MRSNVPLAMGRVCAQDTDVEVVLGSLENGPCAKTDAP